MTAYKKAFSKRMDNGHTLQILSGGGDNPGGLAEHADRALKKARLCLHYTRVKLGQGKPVPEAEALLGRYFFVGMNDDASLEKIRRVLNLIYNGLQSDITLKVGPSIKSKSGMGDANGSVNIYQSPSKEAAERKVEEKWAQKKDWYSLVAESAGDGYSRATGAIKITTSRLMQDLGVKTLLHEASHKYAGTTDEWYYRDSAPDETIVIEEKGSPVNAAGGIDEASRKRAMRNADSFAWFIYLLGSQ
jgi:ribosomal protein S24E